VQSQLAAIQERTIKVEEQLILKEKEDKRTVVDQALNMTYSIPKTVSLYLDEHPFDADAERFSQIVNFKKAFEGNTYAMELFAMKSYGEYEYGERFHDQVASSVRGFKGDELAPPSRASHCFYDGPIATHLSEAGQQNFLEIEKALLDRTDSETGKNVYPKLARANRTNPLHKAPAHIDANSAYVLGNAWGAALLAWVEKSPGGRMRTRALRTALESPGRGIGLLNHLTSFLLESDKGHTSALLENLLMLGLPP